MILEKLECMAFSQSSPRNFLDIAIVYFFCFPPFIPFVGTYKLGQKEHIMIIMLARLASWCKIFFPLAVNLRKQTRMKLLYYMMDIPLPTKNDLKQEAKCIKKFLVHLKLKLARQQVCRSYLFRKLLALVFDPFEQERVGLYVQRFVQS